MDVRDGFVGTQWVRGCLRWICARVQRTCPCPMGLWVCDGSVHVCDGFKELVGRGAPGRQQRTPARGGGSSPHHPELSLGTAAPSQALPLAPLQPSRSP